MIRTTGFVALGIIALIAVTAAMPICSCTPEQAAKIFVEPLRQTALEYHSALVNGDLTEDEYISLLYLHVQVIRVKGIMLDILMAMDLTANEFREGLCRILPWRVR